MQGLGKGFENLVHVDAVGVGPGVLKGLVHALGEDFGYGVEFDELFDALLHFFELLGALEHLDHDGGDVAEDGGAYECCKGERERIRLVGGFSDDTRSGTYQRSVIAHL